VPKGQNVHLKSRITDYRMTYLNLILCFFVAMVTVTGMTREQDPFPDYEALWKEVEDLERKRQFRSALDKVDEIFVRATDDENSPQLVKVFAHRLKFSSYLEEDGWVRAIIQAERSVATMSEPERSIVLSILAEQYDRYRQAYSWQISERHNTSGEDTSSVETWSVEKLKKHAHSYYLASLVAPELKSTDIDTYSAIIAPGKRAAGTRPTLYDILLDRALKSSSRDGFERTLPLAFTKSLYGTSVDFQNADTTGLDAYTRRLVTHLTQRLGELRRTSTTAYIHLDLARLEWAQSIHRDEASYISALEGMMKAHLKDEEVTEIAYLWARTKYYGDAAEEVDRATMKDRLMSLIKKYPQSYGANLSQAFIRNTIDARMLSFTLEPYILPLESNQFLIAYQNVPKAYVHLAKVPSGTAFYRNNFTRKGHPDFGRFDLDLVDELSLPGIEDHREHRAEVVIDPLTPGEYLMVVTDSRKLDEDAITNWAFFNVTSLGAIWDRASIYVYDRGSGGAVEGAEATFYYDEYDQSSRRSVKQVIKGGVSDVNGEVEVPMKERNITVKLKKSEEEVYFDDASLYVRSRYLEEEEAMVVGDLFTDRAIYRPGQTVKFKGVVIEAESSSKALVSGHEVSVRLTDANGQEVEKDKFTTNGFGAVYGSFQIPVDLLPGQFNLSFVDGVRGRTSVRVEAYKRPQTELTFIPDEAQLKLGDTVSQKVSLQTYFGAPLSGSRVQYSVHRVWSTPFYARSGFYRGCYFPWPLKEEEVDRGEVVTNESGEAVIRFATQTYTSGFRRVKPSADYRISVYVIDEGGEAVEGEKRLTLNESPFVISGKEEVTTDLAANEDRQVSISNYDGQAASAEVKMVLKRLTPPFQVNPVKRLWSVPDQFLYTKDEHQTLFPDRAYSDEFEINQWAEETLDEWTADIAGQYTVQLASMIDESGFYVLEVLDKADKLLFKSLTKAYDSREASLPLGFDEVIPKVEVLNLGDNTIRFLTPQGSGNLWVHGRQIGSRWVKDEVGVSLEEGDRNRAFITGYGFGRNRHSRFMQVLPFTKDQNLNVDIVKGWKNKVEPGERVDWTMRLTDDDGNPVKGEIIMTVYDASLDAYQPLHWDANVFRWPSSVGSYTMVLGHQTEMGRQIYVRRDGHEGGGRVYPYLIDHVGHVIGGGQIYQRGMVMEMEMADAAVPKSNADAVTVEEEGGGPEAAKVRSDLTEAAYFAESVHTNEKGEASISFVMSEALGRWNLKALGYTEDLKFEMCQKSFTTSKPLLIQPILTRFLRQGDEAEWSARLVNMGFGDVLVTAQIELFDPITGKDLSSFLRSGEGHTFLLENDRSEVVSWRLAIPSNYDGFIGYRMKIKGGVEKDVQQGVVPVLENSIEVIETFTQYLRDIESLDISEADLDFQDDPKHQNKRYRLEVVSTPLWYVFKTLPAAAEVENPGIEQLVNTYFIHKTGQHVLKEYPWLKDIVLTMPDSSALQVKARWKTLGLEKTPFVRQALSEADEFEAMRNFFGRDDLDEKEEALLGQIRARQLDNGGFSWMPGGRDSWYMSQMVLERLIQLSEWTGLDIEEDWVNRLRRYNTDRFNEYVEEWKKEERDGETHLVSTLALNHILIESKGLAGLRNEGLFLWEEVKKRWPSTDLWRMVTIGEILLNLEDDKAMLSEIKKTMDENRIDGGIRGTFWKYSKGTRWSEQAVQLHSKIMCWYNDMGDQSVLGGMTTWLIQNKRTQAWQNKMSSVAAIRALIDSGQETPGQDPVGVKVVINHETYPEGGRHEIQWEKEFDTWPESLVKLTNPDKGDAWVSIYHKFEAPASVIEASSTSLRVEREIYHKTEDSKLIRLESPTKLSRGDRLLVRLEFQTDRDMEYVALRDNRAAAFEPGIVLSGYQWKGGLGFYRAIADTDVTFYIDFLPRGTHVVEYELQTTHAGDFEAGLATIECLYAPDFRANSDGMKLSIE
jgi:hypothetical protein